MIYPWLDVPILTAPMLIAIIAIAHVIVSHYAVGGGVLLAVENARALRDGDEDYRDYWKKHAKFFIILTVVYGAITGVGIWLTIGLASPLATETLIRTFVFGWAIEWCFFLLEIVSGFAFLYFWDKFNPRSSVLTGAIYAFSAWISLVLITAITAFMLNSAGLIGDWESTGNFWHAFLNVQFLPQTVARTGCALTLSSAYILLHASLCEKNLDIREKITRRMRFPAFLGIFLLVVGVVGWAFFLPESSRQTLERAAATNIFSGLFVAVVVGIVALLIAGPVAKPRETSPASALALCLLGIVGVGVGEFAREAVRKPYVVDRVVYGNQICRADAPRLRQSGLLYNGVWTRLWLDELQEKYPELNISAEKALGWAPSRIEKVEAKTEDSNSDEADAGARDAERQATSDATDDLTYDGSTLDFVGETAAVVQQNGSAFTPTSTVGARNRSTENQTSTSAQSVARDARQPAVPAQIQPQIVESDARISDVSSRVSLRPQNDSTGALDDDSPVSDLTREANSPVDETKKSGFGAGASANGSDGSEESEPEQQIKSNEELDVEINGAISRGNDDLLKVDREDRLALGRAVFLHHCNCCHASDHGYSAVGPMIVGMNAEELRNFALSLNHSHFYMPPWAGTEVEAELLAEYLVSISPKTPGDVFAKPKPKKVKKVKKGAQESKEEESAAEEASDADVEPESDADPAF